MQNGEEIIEEGVEVLGTFEDSVEESSSTIPTVITPVIKEPIVASIAIEARLDMSRAEIASLLTVLELGLGKLPVFSDKYTESDKLFINTVYADARKAQAKLTLATGITKFILPEPVEVDEIVDTAS